jgi:flagellar export protein FliJ
MSRFVYKLDPLLMLREREERERELALAAVEAERRAIEEQVRTGQEEITRCKLDWRGALGGAVDPRAARFGATAALHAQLRTQRLVLQLAGVQRRLETARAELAEASRRRRAVELHRDRRFQQWRRDQSRREDLAVDELATMAAARARPPAGGGEGEP